MSLRDQVEEDLSIFFDLDEMGTVHTIQLGNVSSAKDITVVVDEDEGQRNSVKSPGGQYDGNLLFYARTADTTGIVPDGMFLFDGVPYQVAGCVDEDGISQITLRAGVGGF
jgi:hypothetical protein